MTTTTSTSSVVSSTASQLLTSLNAGSGVDTASLVTSLVSAQFASRTDQLTNQATALTTQISTVASLKSAVTSFASAVSTLVKSGSLQVQPVSGNTGAFTAAALPGAQLSSSLSSSIQVTQIAAAQGSVTATATDPTATIGTGQFTLSFGTATYSADGSAMTGFAAGNAAPVTIAIDAAHASLNGIAAAINAQAAGVTAAVVTDADGTGYLTLKGQTGAAQAFTMQATQDDSGALAQFNVGPDAVGTTLTAVAQNAKLKVDGAAVERASNSVGDLVAGVKLTLVAASAGAVSLTAQVPTDALSSAVSNYAESYNQVLQLLTSATDPVDGPLKTDGAARTLLQQLRQMNSAVLVTGAAAGAPTTLSELGLATNKDGTLTVDTTLLANVLAKSGAGVSALFAYSATATTGLNALFGTLSDEATDAVSGLGASTAAYTAQQSQVTDDQSTLADQKTAMTTRLTQQFAAMSSRVAAYKSTQTFLTNQIAAWNKSSNS